MKIDKIIIYGTGTSAQSYYDEFGKKEKVIFFYETNPSKDFFNSLPVKKFPDKPIEEYDYLIIASMFYPEILELVLKNGFPISKIKIATTHKDDPRFGVLMIDPNNVSKNLDKYKIFSKEIEKLKSFVDIQKPKVISDRFLHLKYCFERSPKEGMVIEFGVYKGETLKYLTSLSKKPVWGFDSFCGALEGSSWDLRDDRKTPKKISNYLETYKHLKIGYFHDTLPRWIKENNKDKISFIHYDAGDYDAAHFVLKNTLPKMQKNAIIVFDEFISSPTELNLSEYKAFIETCMFKYKIISRSSSSVGIQILN